MNREKGGFCTILQPCALLQEFRTGRAQGTGARQWLYARIVRPPFFESARVVRCVGTDEIFCFVKSQGLIPFMGGLYHYECHVARVSSKGCLTPSPLRPTGLGAADPNLAIGSDRKLRHEGEKSRRSLRDKELKSLSADQDSLKDSILSVISILLLFLLRTLQFIQDYSKEVYRLEFKQQRQSQSERC
ncbi:hypothetical protein L6452_21732 [Arctium lappa]|uniref:Uncharacterized protein n=1 Tax=Arctium lappa TaxID=4217 RepID=A0ACB9AX03_ARCLA|nr:hypothetical protein L6452_21732 [Arctium lappa]